MPRGKHPNSLKNLENRVSIHTIPNAVEKANESKRRKSSFRRSIKEALDRGDITTMEQIASKFLKEVDGMQKWAVQLFWEITQDFKNRELKLKDKEVKNQESLLDHMKNVAFVKPVEIGDVTEYEETKREIE